MPERIRTIDGIAFFHRWVDAFNARQNLGPVWTVVERQHGYALLHQNGTYYSLTLN